MKHLFLASAGLEYIKEFVNNEHVGMKMLFIPTAGNIYDVTWWIDKDREVLTEMGFQISELDISSSTAAKITKELADCDIVYIAGGSCFHLLREIRNSVFKANLEQFINKGGLFAGASAGALIAGADIGPIESMDEPKVVSSMKSTVALGFTNIIPIPHYNMDSRKSLIKDIIKKYSNQYTLVPLTDDQAIVVEGENWRIVDSPRNATEMKWMNRHLESDH